MSSEKVVYLPVLTRLDIPVSRVIKEANEMALNNVLIIGEDSDGDLYLHSSLADNKNVLWLIELAKKYILDPQFEG